MKKLFYSLSRFIVKVGGKSKIYKKISHQFICFFFLIKAITSDAVVNVFGTATPLQF